jgi:hypothetical protein
MSDPSDKDRPPKERAKKTELEDTQELPPAKSTAGFFADELRRLDPWTEITPRDPSSEGERVPDPAERVVEVAEVEEADAEESYAGDGPFAAPLDQPPKKRLPPPRAASSLRGIGFGTGAFNAPLLIQRKVGIPASPLSVGQAKRAAEGGAWEDSMRGSDRALVPRKPSGPGEPDHGRRYPKMRALLKNPDRVPHGSEPLARPKPRAVPGTFFPAPRKEKEPPIGSATPADLDEMLVAMAEGLLIGEDAAGHTEVRVTLRDEFFAGTELRITAGEGKVRAVLLPPDRSTYLELNGNIDELRLRLEARGLRVEELRVAEP